jgi:hypothetical protein
MIQLTLFVLANSLWCLGIHYLFIDGPFKRLGDWLSYYTTESNIYWITKPFYNCMPCMASVHGLIGYFYMYETINAFTLVYLIVLLGVNVLVSKYYYEN